jgi:hypothetical protein
MPYDLSPASQQARPQLNTWHSQESEAIPHQQLPSTCVGDCLVTHLLVSATAQAGHGGDKITPTARAVPRNDTNVCFFPNEECKCAMEQLAMTTVGTSCCKIIRQRGTSQYPTGIPHIPQISHESHRKPKMVLLPTSNFQFPRDIPQISHISHRKANAPVFSPSPTRVRLLPCPTGPGAGRRSGRAEGPPSRTPAPGLQPSSVSLTP